MRARLRQVLRRVSIPGRSAGALLAGLLALSGCESRGDGWTDVVRRGDARGYNVLLVTLDTVRRDRLGCYGDEDAETTTIDGLLAHGVRFDDAVASSPLTLPSHATLMTGLVPPNHGARDNANYSVAPDVATLAESLRGVGYETAAFIGCFVLDERFGLSRGFDRYEFEVSARGVRRRMPDFNERPADEVTDAAIRWLGGRQGSAPFFAWVHYFDAHAPYASPLRNEERFRDRGYDAEIAFIDSQIARLLEAVSQEREHTLVVVTADHGEALGEHDEPTHGLLIYDCTIRVPLVLSSPGLFPGSFLDEGRVVGLVDVKATIEDLVGLSSTASGDGVSLLGATEPDRAIYIETQAPVRIGGWSPLAGLRSHTAKYILAPTPEYYDLTTDPGELDNLWTETHPSNDWRPRIDEIRRAASADRRELSEEEIERLQSLGYVQRDGALPTGSGEDPKQMMALFNEALRAEELYASGQYEEAAAVARSVLEQNPGLIQALRVLAFSEVRLGRSEAAVKLLQDSTSSESDVFLLRALAQLLIVTGRLEDARAVLDTYEAADPGDGRVALLRGDCLAREGRTEAALAQYEEARRRDPNRAGPFVGQRIRRLEAEAGQPAR